MNDAAIYLDNNATTRPAPQVVEAVAEAMRSCWGNPASAHPGGQAAKRLMAQARKAVAGLLGAAPAEVLFTSGATEANCAVLEGALRRRSADGDVAPLLILSAIEHAGMLRAARRLAAEGRARLRLLPVDPAGRVDPDRAGALIEPGAALVSVMAANNETGVLQPVAAIAARARAAGVPMHVDATQVAGRVPFDFSRLGIDLASVSAHKLHGPKGCGALLQRKGLSWPELIPGTQERGRRGGTENLFGIAGFGVAAALAAVDLERERTRIAALRDRFEQALAARLPVRVFGAAASRLPNTSYLRIADLDADLVLNRLERNGIWCASGAACSSGGQAPSHVLRAMGVTAPEALAAIRFSLSRETTAGELDATVDALCAELLPRLADAA